jgi:hypothetical protein
MPPTDTTHEGRAPLVELLPEDTVLPALMQTVPPIEWANSNAPDSDPQTPAALVEQLPEEAVVPALLQVVPPQDWTASNSPAVNDSKLPG